MSRRKRKPRVSVLCFYANGTKNKYHFNSKPDFDRVQKDVRQDKVVAAIVFDRKCAIIAMIAPYSAFFYDKTEIGYIIRFLTRLFQNPTTCDKLITSAIVKITEEPEHYNGEPCNLPIYEYDKYKADGLRFEYTSDKKQIITAGDWFETNEEWEDRKHQISQWVSGKSIAEYFLLRAIPIEEAEECK